MKPVDPNQPTIEVRYRSLLTIWFAMCMSLIMFLVFIRLAPVEPAVNPKLTLILNTVGLMPVAASFLAKQILLGRAVATQRIQMVQVAYTLAFALCEIAWLLALVDYRLTGSSYYYVGFAIGGLGMLLHFPRKQPLLDASQQQFRDLKSEI